MSKGKTVEKEKPRTTIYLKQLNEDGIRRIKQKISVGMELLIDKKVHPMAGGLMSILCEQELISRLSVDQLIKMIESIFPETIREEGWITKYGDLLLRIIDEAKKGKSDSRADGYEKHLREILIPALKKGAHTNDVMDDLEPLEDVYKTTVCLYRYYKDKEKKFSFHADRESMDKLNMVIQSIKGVANPVLGIDFLPVRTEDKQYAVLLSWILEELLIIDEELEVGDEQWI